MKHQVNRQVGGQGKAVRNGSQALGNRKGADVERTELGVRPTGNLQVGSGQEDLVVDVELEMAVVLVVVTGLGSLCAEKMLECRGDGVGQLTDIDVGWNTRKAKRKVVGSLG